MSPMTILVLSCFLLAVIGAITLATRLRSRPAQLLLAALLLPAAAYCLFGFLATFEPMERGEQLAFRIGYLVIGASLTLTISGLCLGKGRTR